MVIRTWHGRTKPADAPRYLKYLETKATQTYREVAGNISVRIMHKKAENCVHFWTVTEWTDTDAVRRFAGYDEERAVYLEEDEKYLIEKEAYVIHAESSGTEKSRMAAYIGQLERLYGGENWLDETYLSKLSMIDEGIAFRPPFEGGHSIAAIVWHCIYWRTVLIKRLQGYHSYRDETVDHMNFLAPDQLKAKGWQKLKKELEESQQMLVSLLRSRDDAFLVAEFASGVTFQYFLQGIIEHDAYHLGQIGLVRKMILLAR